MMLAAVLSYPLPLMLATLRTYATTHIRRSAPMLKVVPAGCRQRGLKRSRPLPIHPGHTPDLVGRQIQVVKYAAGTTGPCRSHPAAVGALRPVTASALWLCRMLSESRRAPPGTACSGSRRASPPMCRVVRLPQANASEVPPSASGAHILRGVRNDLHWLTVIAANHDQHSGDK
jgi:hypothetical protein